MSHAFEEVYRNAEEYGGMTPLQQREANVDFGMGLGDWSFLNEFAIGQSQYLSLDSTG